MSTRFLWRDAVLSRTIYSPSKPSIRRVDPLVSPSSRRSRETATALIPGLSRSPQAAIDGLESVCEGTELNAVAVTTIECPVDSASPAAAQRENPSNTIRRNILVLNGCLSTKKICQEQLLST